MTTAPHEAITPSTPSLPRALRRQLARVGTRLRRLSLFRGVGTLGLALAALVALGVAADLSLELPLSARWGIWAFSLVAALTVLVRTIAWPLLRRASWVDLAAVAEAASPGLGNHASTAAAFVAERDRAHGAPALVAAAVNLAGEHAAQLDPVRSIPARSAWNRLALGLGALGLVAAPAILWPDPCGTLLKRFLMPWGDLERPGRYTVSLRGGDRIVAIGDDVPLTADVHPRFGTAPSPEPAILEWTDDKGQRGSAPMAALGEPRRGIQAWRLTLPRVTGPLVVHASSGSARSRPLHLKALPAPRVERLQVRIEPPPYTNRPAAALNNPARVECWQDSKLTLSVTASRPILAASVAWPQERPPGSAGPENPEPRRLELAKRNQEGTLWEASILAVASGAFTFELTDPHGLHNPPARGRDLLVRVDQPPRVVLEDHAVEGPEKARDDDVLTVGLDAQDDLAVAAAELHYELRRSSAATGAPPETGMVEARPAGLGTPRARGEAALALAALGLRPGDQLDYRVRVIDSCPPPRGPHEAWSDSRILSIVADAGPLSERRQAADRSRLQAMLAALKKKVAESRQAAEALRQAAEAAQRDPKAWDDDRRAELSERESTARETAEELRDFARELARSPGYEALARPAQQVADVEAEASRQALAEAARAAEAPPRLEALKSADTRLGAVQNRLDELQKAFDSAARLAHDRHKLAEIATRQDALAARAEEQARAGPADRATLDQLRLQQERLNRELQQVLERSPELKAEALAGRAETAAELARKTRELADRQRAEARQTGDLSLQGAELRALVEAQQNLEAEARKLALEVDAPLAENDRGRLNVAALADPVSPLQRGDLDQARAGLEAAENELRRLARDLEDVRDDPRALARRLAARQEELREQVARIVRETIQNRDDPQADEKAQVRDRLEPLVARQEAIARLAAELPAPREAQDALREARERQKQAIATLREAAPRDMENRQNEARDTLRRLAQAYPDSNNRRNDQRKIASEARQRAEQVARDVERHLRETAPQPGRPYEADRMAAELADRLEPLAQAQAEAAASLEAARMDDRLEPQRRRAARAAADLARALAQVDRQELPDRLTRARATTDRLARKVEGQTPADDIVDELAKEAQTLAADDTSAPAEARAQARRLATALRILPVPDALDEQLRAVRAAESAAGPDSPPDSRAQLAEAARSLAIALADDPAPAPPAPAARDARAPAQALARTQRELAEQLQKVREEAERNPDRNAARAALPDQLAPIQQRQRELTDQTRRLDDPHPRGLPDRQEAELRRGITGVAQDRVLEAIARRDPARAVEQARAAADRLDQLAQALPQEPPAADPAAAPTPADPDLTLDPQDGARAVELARRQRQIRERVQALLADRVPLQQELRGQSVDLGQQFQDLQERVQALSPRSRGPAAEAASLLGQQAPKVMDQGTEQLLTGQASAARDSQRRAAETLEQAAQRAEDLAAALRADSPPPGSPPALEALAEALEAQQQAGEELAQARDPAQGNKPSEQAGQAMKRAADRLREASRPTPGEGQSVAQSQEPGGPPRPGQPGEAQVLTPESGPAGTAEAQLAQLQEQIRNQTGRAWGELPGHLRSEILQMAQGRYRDDYSRLIQLYFREIATAGQKPTNPGPR